MNVSRNEIRLLDGPCNFCNKGELTKSGDRLKYPYKEVTNFSKEGSGLSANICDDCMEELVIKHKKLKDEK